nr:molybdenum cofactor biosynthesis protein MoaE [Aestuariibacter sp. GS-14]
MFARVQTNDFSQQALYDELCGGAVSQGAGAIVTFTGLVRDFNAQGGIQGIELEYYPGMTESALNALLTQASQRFDIVDAGIIHRVGKLANHAQIVWVGTASQHREQAFLAATFIMDMLKQSVPIWKKEWQGDQATWVVAKTNDDKAAMRWLSENQDNACD